ncbi:hypothetical protein [Marinobacter sp. AN1]|uniref:hypothetical protein n=1 Tax=Marinobacter sp. AN1 TaxID=2886046 RepID=UPI0022323B28|nr:hypothetical protein [Marinobacter sp. AN1]UZD64729.1 hypothetical protein LJ360_14120 [Marinobacter sp. AN1]
MQKTDLISGRVVAVKPHELLVARGAKLLKRFQEGAGLELWHTLPVSWWQQLAMQVPFAARALRLGVHHVVEAQGKTVIVANKASYLIDEGGITSLGELQGSRPMALCAAEGQVYYGEYRSNPERSAVHVFGLDVERKVWTPVWSFQGVRHVHGVFYDPYAQAFWVTTGDSNEESAIWRTDDEFSSLKKVVGGSQQVRAVQLLFTEDHVYFGSDAPDEPNHIYRMDRGGAKVERLCPVGGSVFYGCKVGNHLVFSTAVEPSDVNTGKEAEVWHSSEGEHWNRLLCFPKDRLSMKYFQYGQVLFPQVSEGAGNTLYCTPFAVKGHGKTLEIPL